MPWHPRKRDPWYAIRTRKGPRGIVYRVSLCRAGQTVWQLFREREHGSARKALEAARQWRDRMAHELEPETKQAFSERLTPTNTSGQPGVYLRRQIVHRNGKEYEYVHWQAQSPAGAKPWRSRSFSIDRYGYDGAYELAVQARAELLATVEGYVGLAPIPKRFRPSS
jgi:hypothetical protein